MDKSVFHFAPKPLMLDGWFPTPQRAKPRLPETNMRLIIGAGGLPARSSGAHQRPKPPTHAPQSGTFRNSPASRAKENVVRMI
jgi:hypothetical protein